MKWIIIFLFLCSPVYAQDMRIRNEGQHPLRHRLEKVLTNCETDDNYCFKYEDQVLKLYTNATLQVQWPIEGLAVLLLESGSFVNLEDGGRILLE